MNIFLKTYMVVLFVMLGIISIPAKAQNEVFSLDDCIKYALENSTTIGRAANEIKSQTSYLEQRRAERGPDLSLSAGDTWSSSNSYDSDDDSWDRSTGTSVSLSLSSDITLYNGAKLKNSIIQGKVNLSAAETDIKTEKELLSLDVLAAYIDVLLAQEQVNNSQSQLETTTKELEEATIRRKAGVMSPADYLNIRSQYSSDKATLVTSQSELRISLVSLMQVMNMPVSNTFTVTQPDMESLLKLNIETDPSTIYNVALGIQPGVKSAELYLNSAELDIQLAKADFLPSLTLSGSVGSYHYSTTNINFVEQISNRIYPSLGLSLSIPIYQRKEVKNNVKQAVIVSENYQYDLIDVKNDLRKAIEQACTDAQTANSTFLSYQEQLESEKESYKLASEMFSQGMLSSVDFLSSKNNLYEAETNLINAKYEVILQNEIIEYYMGNKIEF